MRVVCVDVGVGVCMWGVGVRAVWVGGSVGDVCVWGEGWLGWGGGGAYLQA